MPVLWGASDGRGLLRYRVDRVVRWATRRIGMRGFCPPEKPGSISRRNRRLVEPASAGEGGAMTERLDTIGRQPRDKRPSDSEMRAVVRSGMQEKRDVKRATAKAARRAAKKLGEDAPKRNTKGWVS